MGVVRRMLPLYIVATQLKTLIAEGIATLNVNALKIIAGQLRLAAGKHVVAPDQEAQQRNRDAAVGDELVAKNVLAAVNRDDFADDAHGGQDHDVHGRVRVEPEEVLEQDRVAAQRGIKDADTERSFGDQQHQRNGQHGRGQQLDDGRGIQRPDEQRHLEPGHALAAKRVRRDQEVQAGEDRTEPQHEGAENRRG